MSENEDEIMPLSVWRLKAKESEPVEIPYANLEANKLYFVVDVSQPENDVLRSFVGKFSRIAPGLYSGTSNLVFKDTFRCIKTFGSITGLGEVMSNASNEYRFNDDPKVVKVYRCTSRLKEMVTERYDRRKEQEERLSMFRNDINQAEEIYEPCGICGYSLDNVMGPPQDEADAELCGTSCNHVIYMCENEHLSHRVCALKCLNLKPVNVYGQMGYTDFELNKANLRSGTCPFCTLPITQESILSQPRVKVEPKAKKRKASEERSSSNKKYKRGGKRSQRVHRRTHKYQKGMYLDR